MYNIYRPDNWQLYMIGLSAENLIITDKLGIYTLQNSGFQYAFLKMVSDSLKNTLKKKHSVLLWHL